MIKEAIKEIDPMTVMFLINTIFFESKWQYKDYKYSSHNFTDAKAQAKKTDFFSGKSYGYYSSERAKAFRVQLDDGYYFLGILPDDNDIYGYIESFDYEELSQLTSNADTSYDVFWRVPKFSYDYSASIKNTLIEMGVNDVFDDEKANLRSLAEIQGENIFVSDVNHKTRIELDKNGIKAAAVTIVRMGATSSAPQETIYLYLDRPFVYCIMDQETNAPIFIGSVKYI